MKFKTATVLSLILMSVYLFSVSVFANQPVYYTPGQVIIQVQKNVSLQTDNGKVKSNNSTLQTVLDDIGASDCEEFFPFDKGGSSLSRTYTITIGSEINVVDAVIMLAKIECVKGTQPNYVYTSMATPTDASYADEWGMRLIQTSSAWDLFTGNSHVVVADLDSGVDYTHQDLADNIWINEGEIPNNGIDDDGNGYVDDVRGWDFVSWSRAFVNGVDTDGNVTSRYYIWKPEDNNPGNEPSYVVNNVKYPGDPIHPHGTHVAGIMGGVGNNSVSGDINIVGVLWNCRIMCVRAGDCVIDEQTLEPDLTKGSSFTYSAIAKGLRYASDNGAQVINMSFGGYGGETGIVVEALKYAHEKGVVLCAAAGNGNTISPSYPASFDHVISVAATDQNDQRASFSDYGPTVDISAPGVGILSSVLDNGYATMDGTSMACPFVSGAAGLIIGYGEMMGKKFNPAQVEYLLKQGADNIDSENPDYVNYLGAGRLNVNNSMLLAQNAPSMLSSILIQAADDPTATDIDVKEHSTRDFQAIAVYSDGTTSDITDKVTWMVRPIRYGSFSNLVPGRFSALLVPGDREVVLTALLDDEDGAFSGQQVITITNDPNAAPLAITGLDAIDPLSSAAYKAIYQAPDGTNTDVTAEVTWEVVTGTEYANFDNSQAGLLLTKISAANQTLVIKATYINQADRQSYEQTKKISVGSTAQQVAGLFMTAPESLTAGNPVQLSAKLIYAGQNTPVDVTLLATWSSSPAAAGSFDAGAPGYFIPGNVSKETTVTLSAQYATNGQVYTAQLQTKVVPATAVAKAPDATTTETDSSTGDDDTTGTDLLSSLPCSLPGLLVLAGLMFSGLVLNREN